MSSRRQAAADDDEARTKRISGIRRSWFPDQKKGLAMTEPRTYPSPSVELPIDPWLLEGTRAAHCKVCTALGREREVPQVQLRPQAEHCPLQERSLGHPLSAHEHDWNDEWGHLLSCSWSLRVVHEIVSVWQVRREE